MTIKMSDLKPFTKFVMRVCFGEKKPEMPSEKKDGKYYAYIEGEVNSAPSPDARGAVLPSLANIPTYCGGIMIRPAHLPQIRLL